MLDRASTCEAGERAGLGRRGFDWLDAQDDILYDRICFRPGDLLPAYLPMFSCGIGQMCPYMNVVKLHAHTNMCAAAPSSFWIRRIHVAVNEDISPLDMRVAREFSWEFHVMQKRFAAGPFVLDMERRSLGELLKGKTPAMRASLEFDHTKGLYIPLHPGRRGLQTSFLAAISTSGYRRLMEGERYRVARDGNGIEFMMTLEGVRWRGTP